MTTPDVDCMTLDQCRDELAERGGWQLTLTRYVVETTDSDGQKHAAYMPVGVWRHTDGRSIEDVHPIPPTLDAIAASMPVGWNFDISYDAVFDDWQVTGWPKGTNAAETSFQYCNRSDPVQPFARLAVACWRAEKGTAA